MLHFTKLNTNSFGVSQGAGPTVASPINSNARLVFAVCCKDLMYGLMDGFSIFRLNLSNSLQERWLELTSSWVSAQMANYFLSAKKQTKMEPGLLEAPLLEQLAV